MIVRDSPLGKPTLIAFLLNAIAAQHARLEAVGAVLGELALQDLIERILAPILVLDGFADSPARHVGHAAIQPIHLGILAIGHERYAQLASRLGFGL